MGQIEPGWDLENEMSLESPTFPFLRFLIGTFSQSCSNPWESASPAPSLLLWDSSASAGLGQNAHIRKHQTCTSPRLTHTPILPERTNCDHTNSHSRTAHYGAATVTAASALMKPTCRVTPLSPLQSPSERGGPHASLQRPYANLPLAIMERSAPPGLVGNLYNLTHMAQQAGVMARAAGSERGWSETHSVCTFSDKCCYSD